MGIVLKMEPSAMITSPLEVKNEHRTWQRGLESPTMALHDTLGHTAAQMAEAGSAPGKMRKKSKTKN